MSLSTDSPRVNPPLYRRPSLGGTMRQENEIQGLQIEKEEVKDKLHLQVEPQFTQRILLRIPGENISSPRCRKRLSTVAGYKGHMHKTHWISVCQEQIIGDRIALNAIYNTSKITEVSLQNFKRTSKRPVQRQL